MGRSVPTYRVVLEGLIQSLNDFRRALRAEDKLVFDELMRKARLHSSASGYQTSLDPAESMFLSILIELAKDNERLRKELRGGAP